MRVFDEFVQGSPEETEYLLIDLRKAFEPMILAAKIMTLDKPADILRYTIRGDVLGLETVKDLLLSRSEFSRPAISNVMNTLKSKK